MEFSFAQNQAVEDVGVVPETFRGAYVKGDDGKFNLNPDMAGFTTAIDGLNKALRSEREANKGLKGQPTAASVLESLGFDSVDTAKAKFDEMTQTIAERVKVDPAKIKADIEATFNNEREGFKTQLSGMEQTLFKHLVQNTAREALSAHKGNELFLMPHIERAAKVVKDDTGDYVVRVVDSEGQYRGNGQGGFMGVTDLVGELKANKSFAGAFESQQQGGGGNPPNPQNRQAVKQAARMEGQGDKTAVDKISSGLQNLNRA